MSEYYGVKKVAGLDATVYLRNLFPTGEADELNFVFFSTSGIHGSYITIEEISEESLYPAEITYLLIHPRTVAMVYGTLTLRNSSDVAWAKKLRATSLAVVAKIGRASK